MKFDYIVVGAGTAGCVMAVRLSERPDRRVLLVEAGSDIVPEPWSVRSPFPVSHGVPGFRWPDITANIKSSLHGAARATPQPFLQGRLVGGGGSLMGMIALRGLPADYDEWRDEGALGWSWKDVLPYFRQLETDHDFIGALHGADGAIPLRRYRRADWSPFAEALGSAFERDGFPFIADANADFHDGHIGIPHSSLPDRRVSSAAGYLDGKARARPNLTLWTDAKVERLLVRDGRAEGVTISAPQGARTCHAREIVLCCGGIMSPYLLLRSGIGPASELQQSGVAPVHNLPAVGQNLNNHPIIYLSALLPPAMRQPGGALIYNALRYSSGERDCPAHDMLLPLINRTAWHSLGHHISAIGVSVYKSASRGSVSLTRQGSDFKPGIDLGMFSDMRDLVRLANGFKRAYQYLVDAANGSAGFDIFAATNMKLMARLADPRPQHGALAWLISRVLDGPSVLRRHVLRNAGVNPASIIDDDERLMEFVYQYSSPMYHPAGTCRMGPRNSQHAVVDERCRIIGIAGLRVADASVMPAIVRANTNIPTIMVAEKAAAMIREDEKR